MLRHPLVHAAACCWRVLRCMPLSCQDSPCWPASSMSKFDVPVNDSFLRARSGSRLCRLPTEGVVGPRETGQELHVEDPARAEGVGQRLSTGPRFALRDPDGTVKREKAGARESAPPYFSCKLRQRSRGPLGLADVWLAWLAGLLARSLCCWLAGRGTHAETHATKQSGSQAAGQPHRLAGPIRARPDATAALVGTTWHRIGCRRWGPGLPDGSHMIASKARPSGEMHV